MHPARLVTAFSCLLVSLASPARSAGVESRDRLSAMVRQDRSPIDLDADFASLAPTAPGCAVGVALAGAAPLIRSHGLADLEHPAPITAESIFETGSLAKQFTATAMLMLVQDGRLTLDDDIRRYLPEMPDYGTPITIRHLLNHTSGLREQWSLLALAGRSPGTQVHGQGTILDLAARQKALNFAPGTEFLYTNTNYVLAAIIVERVSGKSLQRFTDERLFQPLGMTHSRWREDFRTVVPGRAMAYAAADNGFVTNMPFTNVHGNGGLLTTIGDLLRWNAFLDDPSRLPGGQALAAALQSPGRLRDGTALEYALGLEVTRSHGLRLVSHSGSTGGYRAWLGRYPERHISVALLCNNGGIDPVGLGERVAARALRAVGHRGEDVADTPSPAIPATARVLRRDLASYQGLFRDPVTGELVETRLVDAELRLRQGESQALIPGDGDQFRRADGDRVRIARREGKPTALTIERGPVLRHFVAVAPARTDDDTLAAYVGTYYSAELDTRISVVRQGDTLVMRQPFGIEWPLTPSFADGFTARLRGTTGFVFTRGLDGKVDGVAAWANGVRNLRFARQPR